MGMKHESMVKKFERIVALTIAISILLTGCGNLATEPRDTDDPSEEKMESVDSLLSRIGIIEDLSFEVIKAAVATIEYDGTEKSLEVTDENGLTWQLTIPENALAEQCTITLTPLSNVESERKKDGLSGILMEPDGLAFIKPASLTVTGPDADKLLFLSGTQDGKNYSYQPDQKSENGARLLVYHFSSVIASDAPSDAEVYRELKKYLPRLKKEVESSLSKSIKVPDIIETPMECYRGIPNIVIEQLGKWFAQEGANAVLAGMIMDICEQQGDKIGVNDARRLWLDSIRRFFQKEKAYYDKYHAQYDKFIFVPRELSRLVGIIITAGGEEPPADVVAMYEDYESRTEKWAYESAKYSIDKIREHHYKYAAYAIECIKHTSYDHKGELSEELRKALTFKLKIKAILTQQLGDVAVLATSEGEGKMLPEWSAYGTKMTLTGDVNINTTISGFFAHLTYSPTNYTISAKVRDWDPCETESCNIWVSTIGLEEEKILYDDGDILTEVLAWDLSNDNFEKELEEGFHVRLHNLEENVVSESFSAEDAMFDIITLDVFFDLIHTPQ